MVRVFRREKRYSGHCSISMPRGGVRETADLVAPRILVGDDAHVLDRMLREDPEGAYTQAFYDRLLEQANWRLGQLGGS